MVTKNVSPNIGRIIIIVGGMVTSVWEVSFTIPAMTYAVLYEFLSVHLACCQHMLSHTCLESRKQEQSILPIMVTEFLLSSVFFLPFLFHFFKVRVRDQRSGVNHL